MISIRSPAYISSALRYQIQHESACQKFLSGFQWLYRWGQLLYQSSDKNAGWNGTFNGKLQLSETYVWVVEAVDQDGKNILKTGKTTLIR
jgi:gliding motility-associated-like protein